MNYLIGGICALVAITFVGHGLWLLFSWPFRQADPLRTSRRCPRCGLPIFSDLCGACNWPGGVRPNETRALELIGAQVGQLGKLGVLSSTASEQLGDIVSAELRARQPGAAPAARPPVAPVEPFAPVGPVAPQVVAPIAAQIARPKPAEPVATAPPAELAASVAPAPRAPSEPQRSWSDWLAGFMEERNIRWGELVGGLLIVCSSIALVISFWSAIQQRPWLEFVLFNGATAAILGVGFYSEYRWRLPTTSRGLLTIGCLLVPLNFLAIAALSSAPDAGGVLTIAGEAVSAVLLTVLVYAAARVLIGSDEAALTAGVMVPALAQLLVRRFVQPGTDMQVLAPVAAVPLAAYLASSLWYVRRFARELVPDEGQIHTLFRFVGLTTFAVALPLALLTYKTGDPLLTLRRLPLLAGLVGFVPLCGGLAVWQSLAGRRQIGLRTAGLSVAIFGAAISVAGLPIGWPEPFALLPAALVELAIFTLVAWRFKLPAAHLLGAACLAIACLVGANLLNGQLAWSGNEASQVASVLVSGESGTLLAPLVFLYAGLTVIARRRAADSGWAFGVAALALNAVSVALLAWFGFGTMGIPLGKAWIYLAYAAGWWALATRTRRAAPGWIGAALLLSATVQLVVFHYGQTLRLENALGTAFVLHATICVGLAVVLRKFRLAVSGSPIVATAWKAALAVSVLAAGSALLHAPTATFDWQAAHWLWLAALWGAIALGLEWLPVGTLAQAALALSVVLATIARLAERPWFQQVRRSLWDPWSWQAIGIALVALNLAWIVVRLVCRAAAAREEEPRIATRVHGWLNTPWLSIDRVTTVGLIALLLVLSVVAALPGVAVELSPAGGSLADFAQDWQRQGVVHQHAGQWGSWLLLAGLLVLVAATLRDWAARGWLSGWYLIAAAGCPLLAYQFQSQRAVATGLVWACMAYLLAASLTIWSRRPIAALAQSLGWPTWPGEDRARVGLTSVVLALGLVPPAVLAIWVSMQAIGHQQRDLSGVVLVVLMISGGAIVAAIFHVLRPAEAKSLIAPAERPLLPLASSALALWLVALPLATVVLYQISTAIAVHPPQGPAADSWFARLGFPLAYGGPLALATLAVVGHALRERSGGFALSGGLALLATAASGWLLADASRIEDAATWIRLAQIGAAVSAAYTIGWVAIAAWDRSREGRYGLTVGGNYYDLQAMLAPAITAILIGVLWGSIAIDPAYSGPRLPAVFSDAWAFASLGVTALAVSFAALAIDRAVSQLGIHTLAVAVVTLIAAVASHWDQGNLLAYRTLFSGHVLLALACVAWSWWRCLATPTGRDTAATQAGIGGVWASVQLAIVILLASGLVRLYPWWTVAGWLLAGLVCLPAMAWIYQRRAYLYLAAPLVNAAGTLAARELQWLEHSLDFWYANVLLLAAPVPLWMLIEREVRGRTFAPRVEIPPLHQLVTRLAVGLLAMLVGIGLLGDYAGHEIFVTANVLPAWPWCAVAATVAAVLAGLWDRECSGNIGLVYAAGLLLCGTTLDAANLPAERLLWISTLVLGGYALVTSACWNGRRSLTDWTAPLGIEPRTESAAWLVPCNLLLALVVVVLSLCVLLGNANTQVRVAVAFATLLQTASLGLLAASDSRGRIHLDALLVGAVGAVYFGWAWLELGSTFTLLHALAIVGAATAVTGMFYGLGLSKLLEALSPWLRAAQRATPILAVISGVATLVSLGVEIEQFARLGQVTVAWPAIITVGLTLLALALGALAAAILPGRDPLGLSERGRTVYVYAAEILLALLFVHIRVTMPWLFRGFFTQFWPLIVIALAYLGVGAAELFRRRQHHVLAVPLENTGALLPALPVLGYWVADSRIDYSLLLLAVGLLYGGLSIARRSFGFGILAALAANGGLWYFLGRQEGWGFLTHPQLWLIPPALCVLAAGYINRRQLSEAQLTAIRYGSSMAIYLSSTADIFLSGVAQAPWLPLVLAGLSIAGILAGILLRVRAFLFLGTAFLALALFTVIWYAAVDLEQTWIWYACLMLLGLAMFVFFGLFEKRKRELFEVVERLKQWDA